MTAVGTPPIRVLVVEDQSVFRLGVVALLSTAADVQVVGEAGDGAEAIEQAEILRPDVVVLDLRMPGMDGIEAARLLTADSPAGNQPIRVLALTTYNDDDSVYEALAAGVDGYLVKDQARKHLLAAVHAVAAGESWIDSTIARRILQAVVAAPRAGRPPESLIVRLTPREREVLALIGQAFVNSEIARRLVVSEATVRTHVSRILYKTSSRNRSEAVALAYTSGLLAVPPRR